MISDKKFLKLSDVAILRLLRENYNLLSSTTFYRSSIKFLIDELSSYYKKHQRQENKIVKNLGGLYIIGNRKK